MKTFRSILKNSKGFTLVESLVAVGLMGVGALAMMAMQENSMKGVATVEYKLKRNDLKSMITNQFLSDPENCKCLFQGITPFTAPAAPPGITLTGASPAKLGRMMFPTPGSCTGATIPNPIISKDTVIGGVKASDIKITDVTGFNGLYTGNLTIDITTEKKMMGASNVGIKIPITLSTSTSGGNQIFESCSAKSVQTNRNVGFSFDSSDGVGSTLPARTGSFSFANVPPTAKALMVAYTIGSPTQGRSDRNCNITGGKTNILLGTDSKGDGGQRMVAGSAFVPLNPCGSGLRVSCNNSGGQGNFTVLAVVDDGEFNCASTGTLCAPGFVLGDDGLCYDANDVYAPPTCPTPGQVIIGGVCQTPPTGTSAPSTSTPSSTSPVAPVIDYDSIMRDLRFAF